MLPISDSVSWGFLEAGCLAGCFWTVEVRAGVCRLPLMLLLSNQDPLTELDAEPGGGEIQLQKVISYRHFYIRKG